MEPNEILHQLAFDMRSVTELVNQLTTQTLDDDQQTDVQSLIDDLQDLINSLKELT